MTHNTNSAKSAKRNANNGNINTNTAKSGNTESARVNNTPVVQAPMSVERALRILAEARDARKALAAWKRGELNAEAPTAAQFAAVDALAELRKAHKRIYTLASAQMRTDSKNARTKAVALGIIAATNADNTDTDNGKGEIITLHARAKSALGNALRKCGREYYNTLAQRGVTRSHVLAAVDTLDANTLNGLRDGIGWQSKRLVDTATAAALKAHGTRK